MNVTVKTPFLLWLGIASIAAAFFVSLVVVGGWVEIALIWGLFAGLGSILVLMSATIEATEEIISVRRLFSTAQIRWSDVVAASAGGGNLVLYSSGGRVSMPSTEFWVGSQSIAMQSLIAKRLLANGVQIRRTIRAAAHVDSRSPNKSVERTRER